MIEMILKVNKIIQHQEFINEDMLFDAIIE